MSTVCDVAVTRIPWRPLVEVGLLLVRLRSVSMLTIYKRQVQCSRRPLNNWCAILPVNRLSTQAIESCCMDHHGLNVHYEADCDRDDGIKRPPLVESGSQFPYTLQCLWWKTCWRRAFTGGRLLFREQHELQEAVPDGWAFSGCAIHAGRAAARGNTVYWIFGRCGWKWCLWYW